MLKHQVSGLDYISELVSITFEVTYACDKSCSYCYNPLPRRNGIKDANKKRILDELMNIDSPLQVLILGGEPTLYSPSIDFFNDFSTKYNGDEKKHITYFTHGNNKSEFYERFKGGNHLSSVSMSFHLGQTDERLWFENMAILKKNNVNVVVCFLIQQDISQWGYCVEILNKAISMGCETDVSVEIDSNDASTNIINGYLDIFEQYKYKCFKIKNISIVKKGEKIVEFCRNEYYDIFPNGYSNIEKMCRNQVFSITPYGILGRECGVGEGIDISESPSLIHKYIKDDQLLCKSKCTGLASTLNEKVFLNAHNIKAIKG